MDDELITPISDNEYVLKGSELSHAPICESFGNLLYLYLLTLILLASFAMSIKNMDIYFGADELSCGDGKKPEAVEEVGEGVKVAPEKSLADTLQIEPDHDGVSPKPPPCLDQDSPSGKRQGSDASNESIGRTALFNLDLSRELEKEKRKEGQVASPAMADHGGNRMNNRDNGKHSRRASHVLRNILTCGQVQTNDSALRTIKRRNSASFAMSIKNMDIYFGADELSCGDGKKPEAVEEVGEGVKVAPEKSLADTLQIEPDHDGVSPKPPPCLDQDSPSGKRQGSDASNESIGRTALFNLDLSRELEKEKRKEGQVASPAMADHGGNRMNNRDNGKHSRRASHVLRNILTCGQVQTNDSALRTIKRRNSGDESRY
ncbi:hypothetical protein COCNU_06G014160 [Cocos nucifera]|uniref:Uncharacterized protein n=1 Tax=Cocos nucifera TaxID=13894 RepID=A0A8K0N402_COCNU|nr:hypothetical protein COCNU_06G014160 [Cocos nucifera]